MKYTKAEKSWIMYDLAHSSYSVIVLAAIFPIYFAQVARANGAPGDVWWGFATSAASLIVALSAPILGAVGDFRGWKKRLWLCFLVFGALFTAAMAFTDNPMLMLIGYVLSFIGYEGSNLFYDSFLTDVTSAGRMHRVSAAGFAVGYIGGCTPAFLIAIALLTLGPAVGISSVLAVKLSLIIACFWWLAFSYPLLRHVHQQHFIEKRPETRLIRQTFANIAHTVHDFIRDKRLLFFILAYFFYIDGVNTVISMATSYGSTLGLSSSMMMLALLMIQVLAFPFALLYGHLADRVGVLRMLQAGVLIYTLICLLGFYMGFSLEGQHDAYQKQYFQVVDNAASGLDAKMLVQIKTSTASALAQTDRRQAVDRQLDSLAERRSADVKAGLTKVKQAADPFLSDHSKSASYASAIALSTVLFWLIALLVSTSQGGVQALSRSYFAQIIPNTRSNEFFGFYDIFGKFASIMGPFFYAFFASLTGRSSVGILSLILIFAAGFGLLLRSQTHSSGTLSIAGMVGK
ncbi:MAG: MFS transporter [Sporolactobacillus sp.]